MFFSHCATSDDLYILYGGLFESLPILRICVIDFSEIYISHFFF